MAIQTPSILKQKFETGRRPTQQDFNDLIDTTAGLAANAVSGWVALYRDIHDSGRLVRQLYDYANGTGAKPTAHIGEYIKVDGSFTANIAEAANFSPVKTGTISDAMLALPIGVEKQSPVVTNTLNYDGCKIFLTDNDGVVTPIGKNIYEQNLYGNELFKKPFSFNLYGGNATVETLGYQNAGSNIIRFTRTGSPGNTGGEMYGFDLSKTGMCNYRVRFLIHSSQAGSGTFYLYAAGANSAVSTFNYAPGWRVVAFDTAHHLLPSNPNGYAYIEFTSMSVGQHVEISHFTTTII